jgi:outer membrane protein OmpA-like peptidoglycan-associated protein
MRAVLAASMLILTPVAASAGICVGTVEECTAALADPAVSVDLMVNFELDSDRLSESAKAHLLEFSRALSDPRLANARFSIEGHTDATGSESLQSALSERRAEAVVRFLREQGIDPSRFVVTGYGQSGRAAKTLTILSTGGSRRGPDRWGAH